MTPSLSYDKSILRTVLKTAGTMDQAEWNRASESIAANGMAIIENFVAADTVKRIRTTAETVCSRGYGYGLGVSMVPFADRYVKEFRHPYVCSRDAVNYVLNESLLSLLESFLGPQPIIHNALFQINLPRTEQMLDYHIDCGSVKALNPGKKFNDFRLRTILYLSDVDNGGFSYILNSAPDALKAFYDLPNSVLFPPAAVPPDPDRRIIVNAPAGTLIIFNTHGLHRPEINRTPRVVLNTWFARQTFSGNLPATLFSFKLVPEDRRHRLHIFENERGCALDQYLDPPSTPDPMWKRVLKALRPPKADNYAYFE